jgi:hypothetical protein
VNLGRLDMPGGCHGRRYGTTDNSERQENGNDDFLDAHGSSMTFSEARTLFADLTGACPALGLLKLLPSFDGFVSSA